jgi:hypothetical protein
MEMPIVLRYLHIFIFASWRTTAKQFTTKLVSTRSLLLRMDKTSRPGATMAFFCGTRVSTCKAHENTSFDNQACISCAYGEYGM